jgi:hypothetical protein
MDKKSLQVVASVGTIVGVAGGILGVKLIGLNFLFALLSFVGCGLVFQKAAVNRYLVLPLAFAAGHAAWFLVAFGIALAVGADPTTLLFQIGPDLVCIGVLVAWIYVRRSKASLYGLIVYEIVGIGLNIVSLLEISAIDKSVLALRIAVRCGAILSAILALRHHKEIAASA